MEELFVCYEVYDSGEYNEILRNKMKQINCHVI